MKLSLALKPVSYNAQLVVVKKNKSGGYDYVFPKDELVTRFTIEQFYPELLDMELTNGFHGEGIRDGLYVHI